MPLHCPYCEEPIDDPDDCYEPCRDYVHECPHCDKSFVFQVEYSRDYSASKAECLNGGGSTGTRSTSCTEPGSR